MLFIHSWTMGMSVILKQQQQQIAYLQELSQIP